MEDNSHIVRSLVKVSENQKTLSLLNVACFIWKVGNGESVYYRKNNCNVGCL